jgi:hypothetical protein
MWEERERERGRECVRRRKKIESALMGEVSPIVELRSGPDRAGLAA